MTKCGQLGKVTPPKKISCVAGLELSNLLSKIEWRGEVFIGERQPWCIYCTEFGNEGKINVS